MDFAEIRGWGTFVFPAFASLGSILVAVVAIRKFCKHRWYLIRVRWFNYCEKRAIYSLEGSIGELQINEIGADVDWFNVGNVQYHHVTFTLPRALEIPLEWGWVQARIDVAQMRTSRRWLFFKHREVIGSVEGVATSSGIGTSLNSDKIKVSLGGAGLFAVREGRRHRLGVPEVRINLAEPEWAQWHQSQQAEWEARQPKTDISD